MTSAHLVPTLPSKVALLVRISDDRDGDEEGVKRQEVDGRRLAATLGWTIAEVVVENDTSAFKRRRVRLPNGRTELRVFRPGLRKILELIEAGAIDGLIVYDLDRTARDPRDLEDLIDAVEQRVPRLPVRSVTGSLQLDNDADVTMARVMVALANKSSRDTSRRIKRKLEDKAAAGEYGGGGARRYGYERDGVTIREDEAEVIRETAQRILDGDSAVAICKDLDARGIRPVKAERWSSKTLIDVLRSPRIAGLRVHHGEVVGKAAWPAIVSLETHEQLVAQLAANSHGRGKLALRYWCNQLLWCDRCGQHLSGSWIVGEKHRYWCATNKNPRGCGKIGIAGLPVEQEIERQVLKYLGRGDVLAALANGVSSAAIEETRRLADEDERQLKELARAHGNRQISMPEWLEARAPVEARLRGYRQTLTAVVPLRVRRVLEAEDQRAAWDQLEPMGKREVARVILASGGFKGWVVAPADLSKPRRFDPTRLSLALADLD